MTDKLTPMNDAVFGACQRSAIHSSPELAAELFVEQLQSAGYTIVPLAFAPLEHEEAQRVTVQANDYSYEGYIVAEFRKLRSGAVRYVVEDDNGRLFIHNSNQLGRQENE